MNEMPLRRRHRNELGGTRFRLWAPAARMVEFVMGPHADGG